MEKVRFALMLITPPLRGWKEQDVAIVRAEVTQVGGTVENLVVCETEILLVKVALKRIAIPALEGGLQATLGERLSSHGWCECADDEPLKEVPRRGMRMDASERVIDRRLVDTTAPAVGGLDY